MYWRATHTLSLDSLNYSHSYVHHYLTSRLITPLKLLSSSCWWCPYWQILWPFIHLYIIIIFAIDNILPRTLYSLGFSDISSIQFSVRLFATPWTAACQAYLSITNSRSLLKLMSTESVMPSNHLILCHPLLLPPSIFPNIRIFSNESVLCIRWPR